MRARCATYFEMHSTTEMINRESRVLAVVAAMMLLTAGQRLAAQPSRIAVGLGAQVRETAAEPETPIGIVGDVVWRSPRGAWTPRASLGLSFFARSGVPNGRVCNPDAPCEYRAPELGLVSASVGVERGGLPLRMRGLLGLAAHAVVTSPVPRGDASTPNPRRGERATVGAQAGIVVPIPRFWRTAELEVRGEWLASALESTRMLVPVMLRIGF